MRSMEIPTKQCTVCEAIYYKRRTCSRKDWEQSRYCSLSCSNGDRKADHLKEYRFKEGVSASPATQFKKGELVGDKSPTWKGDAASYAAKHMWIKHHYGSASDCENIACERKSTTFQWSNISGLYRREREDWQQLCVPCHKQYDIRKLGGKIKAKQPFVKPTKVCPQCSIEFSKNPRLTRVQWETQTQCSRKCLGEATTARYEAATKPSKSCEVCKAEFFKGKYTSRKDWNERRFCGRKCGASVSANVRLGVKQSEETRKKKSEAQFKRYRIVN